MNEKLVILTEYSTVPCWTWRPFQEPLPRLLLEICKPKTPPPVSLGYPQQPLKTFLTWYRKRSRKWKYRNSQCNFEFPLTLPKATGFSKPLVSNWDEVGPDEVWSNLISPPTMNGLVVLQAYVVLHVTKSQKSTSDIHCRLLLAQLLMLH